MEQALKIEDQESPFVEGTYRQWAWDATSLNALKDCPYLYKLEIIEGWRPKEDNIHFRFGGEVHTSFEQYHKLRADGIDHDEAVFHVIRELLFRIHGWDPDVETKAGKYKNRVSLVRTVVDYLDFYEEDAAKTYVVNGKPAVELTFQFDSGIEMGDSEQTYLMCGHLDRVVDFHGDLFVMDYKTTTTTPGSYYFEQYEPNNQMTLYTLASQVILEAPVKGVIIDAVQILIDSTRSVRSLTYRTESQLEEWREDLTYWFGLAEHYATHEHWPMNDRHCPRCKFREICSKAPEVREKFLESSFERGERWNPLKPR